MAHHDHVALCHGDRGLTPGDVRELLTYVEPSHVGGRADTQRAHSAVGPAKADNHGGDRCAEPEHMPTRRRRSRQFLLCGIVSRADGYIQYDFISSGSRGLRTSRRRFVAYAVFSW